MKRKIIICVVFFILIILIQLKANAATEINLINKTDKYDLKNKTAFMEIETIKSNNKTYNIVFLSTEFYQNFLENSYYDQENQIFYFYGKNDDEYVKGNDSTYYYGDTILPLVQNLNVCTKVIDGRLYIPLPMYMQRIAYELKIGFDETSNSLLFFGPTRTLPSNASFPTIENVEIKEQIYDEALYYNLDNQGEISREYLTIDYLKTQIYGNVEYYTAIIDGKACVVRVYYEFTDSDCVYDRYEIINEFDGEDIKKLDEVGKYLIIKKNDKYGLLFINGEVILDTIYDEITLEKLPKTSNKSILSRTLNFNLSGNIIKLKKDSKYTLYSLDSNKNIIQNKWFDDINTSVEIKNIAPSSMNDTYKEKDVTNMTCIYNNGKMGLVLGEDILTDAIYTNIEAIRISYSYSASDDLIDMCEKILAWKLYTDDGIYILTQYDNNGNFHNLGNYYLSDKAYKEINTKLENNKYIVYGNNGNSNEEEICYIKNKDDSNENNKIGKYIIISSLIVIICIIIFLIKIRIKKKINKEETSNQ